MATYITSDLVILLITIAFAYLIYQKDRLIGNITLFAICFTIWTMDDINKIYPFILFGITTINLLWDILTPSRHSKETGLYQ